LDRQIGPTERIREILNHRIIEGKTKYGLAWGTSDERLPLAGHKLGHELGRINERWGTISCLPSCLLPEVFSPAGAFDWGKSFGGFRWWWNW